MILRGQLRDSDFYYGQWEDVNTLVDRNASCFGIVDIGNCPPPFVVAQMLKLSGYKTCTVLAKSHAFDCAFRSSLTINFGYKAGRTFNIAPPELKPAQAKLSGVIANAPECDEPYRPDFPEDWQCLLESLQCGWTSGDYRRYVNERLPNYSVQAYRPAPFVPCRLESNCFILHPSEHRLLNKAEYNLILNSAGNIATWMCYQAIYYLRNDWATKKDYALFFKHSEQKWLDGYAVTPDWKVNDLNQWIPRC